MKNNPNTSIKSEKQSFWKLLLTKVIYPSSLIYTVLTMIFYLCGPLFDLTDRYMVLTRKSGFLLLVFAIITSVANIVLTQKKYNLHISLRVTIHYTAMLISFYILFLSVSGYDAGKSSTIILLFVFSIIYFIICGIVFAIRGKAKRVRIDSSEYKRIYD